MAAMALACGPDLLILDEPTTALDVTTQIEVLTAFKDIIKQQNNAAIYVTHDLHGIEELCPRGAILDHGRVVASGSMAEILSEELPSVRDYLHKLGRVPS